MGWNDHGPVYLPLCQKMHGDERHLSLFGCHVTVSNMAPEFSVRYISSEGEVSLPCSCCVLLIVSLSSSVVIIPCH